MTGGGKAIGKSGRKLKDAVLPSLCYSGLLFILFKISINCKIRK